MGSETVTIHVINFWHYFGSYLLGDVITVQYNKD